jgi:hypothetical protein
LAELIAAYRYARASKCSVWDFAVEFECLRAAGLTHSDLRYLWKLGVVEHGVETRARGKARRAFRRLDGWAIGERTCVILTGPGASWLEAAPPAPGAGGIGPPGEKPHWDGVRRELRLGGHVVKRFRQPAACQELVLAAFEEEGWPPSILDPLPPWPGQDRKVRLRQCINNLNRWQKPPTLHFFGNGGGKSVCWELVS